MCLYSHFSRSIHDLKADDFSISLRILGLIQEAAASASVAAELLGKTNEHSNLFTNTCRIINEVYFEWFLDEERLWRTQNVNGADIVPELLHFSNRLSSRKVGKAIPSLLAIMETAVSEIVSISENDQVFSDTRVQMLNEILLRLIQNTNSLN